MSIEILNYLCFRNSHAKYFSTSGVGIGPGIPGLQFGLGFGAGCGVGLGFGYGMGMGIAEDEYRRYSNVGNSFRGSKKIISE
jgi:hypothetical protein